MLGLFPSVSTLTGSPRTCQAACQDHYQEVAVLERRIYVTFTLDMGLNPLHYRVSLRDEDDEFVAVVNDHCDAFGDWNDAIDHAREAAAQQCVDVGWWA